jgi:hypothetical protein
MGMNRIYQGRVSKVLDNQNQELDLHVLWQHHELFQDAVNYYIVCLLALAGDLCAKQRELRDKMTTKPKVEGEEPLYVWERFRRRGAWRRGLGDSVAPFFCPGKKDVLPEECLAAARAGCKTNSEGQDLAFAELLFVCDGDNPIKNQGRWMFDRFCNPKYTGSFPFDAAADLREKGEAQLKSDLHNLSNQSELESFSRQAELGWVVNLARGANAFESELARERLLKSVVHFQQAFGAEANTEMSNRVSTLLSKHATAEKELNDIAQRIKAMAADALPKIPANNRGIADRVEAFMLFKQFHRRSARWSYGGQDGGPEKGYRGKESRHHFRLVRIFRGRKFRPLRPMAIAGPMQKIHSTANNSKYTNNGWGWGWGIG